MKHVKNRRFQHGFTAFEAMIVLIVAISMLGLGAQYLSNHADNLANQATAEHMNLVADAASRYIKDNYDVVLALASPTKPATIIVSMLKNAGYLPTTVTDLNPFGQSYQILALKTNPKQLQTLIVTSNGETIAEINLRRIAQLVGARGGFIAADNQTTAQGSYGGWQMALSAYDTAPGAGHLASALFFDDGALVTDYLYRVSVAGHPELNRMQTDLDLDDHDLNRAAQVNAKNLTASENIKAKGELQVARAQIEGDTTTGGWFRSNGDSGWYNQKWQGGWYMSDPDWVRSYWDKNVYTGGQMRAGTVHSQSRLTAGEFLQINGVAGVGWGCGPNGLVARDGNGSILSCQFGSWQPAADSGQIYTGYNPECPAPKIPLAKHWTQREAWTDYGLHCGLPTGWGSNMNAFCEACFSFERCHILYSQQWNAVYCR